MSYYVTHAFQDCRRVLILCIAIQCVFRRGGARGAICKGVDRHARKGMLADGLSKTKAGTTIRR